MAGPEGKKAPAKAKAKRAPAKKKAAALLGNHTSRPDLDNLLKAVLDALNGVAFLDDSQITEVRAVKSWWERSQTVVEIEEAS